MLSDKTLKQMFGSLLPGQPLPPEPDGPRSAVQPSSIDLRIGNIYVPDVGADELGGLNKPRAEYVLQPGQTAVVTTLESLDVPSHLGAIGFPPTRVSDNGILMTNPGHIDPGYRGKLSGTVINMGRQSFELKQGDRVLTLVFFTLDSNPDADYILRNPSAAGAAQIKPERLDRLAPDMLNVDERVQTAVNSAEHRTRRLSIGVPLALAAVVGLGTIAGPLITDWVSSVDDVQRRVEQLEKTADVAELKARIAELEEEAATTTSTTP